MTRFQTETAATDCMGALRTLQSGETVQQTIRLRERFRSKFQPQRLLWSCGIIGKLFNFYQSQFPHL